MAKCPVKNAIHMYYCRIYHKLSICAILVKTTCRTTCVCVRVYVHLSKCLHTHIPATSFPLHVFFLGQAAAKGTELDENGRLTFYIHNDAATSLALHCAHVGVSECKHARTTYPRNKRNEHHFSREALKGIL